MAATGITETTDVLDAPETRRYLDDAVRVWLGLRDRDASVPELPRPLARLVLRLEEYESPRRDRWGCWDFAFSENFHAGRLWEPEVDRWLADRRAELDGRALEPLWPDGKRFVLCLTHDVDLVSRQSTPAQVARYARGGLAPGIGGPAERVARLARPPVRVVRALRWGVSRAPSTHDTLERSVSIEADRGAHASYFFTVPPKGGGSRYDCTYDAHDRCTFRGRPQRLADVMRTLAEEGFDVGLHGSYRSAVEPGLLAGERATLEAATGLEISTTRQHFLHWDVRWTPQLQEAAGLRADSTLGFNRNIGFRAGTSLPFRFFDVKERRVSTLIELPLVVQDVAVLDPTGLGLDLELARRVVGRLLDDVADLGGAVTLLFHPDKLARPDWLALYESCLDGAFERDGWLTSLAGVERWWSERERRLLG